MKTLLPLLLIFAFLGLQGLVRFSGSDPDRWHVDPLGAEQGPGRFVVRPEGGDVAAPVYDETPQALLERLDTIAMATERTKRLAGSVESGQITYVTRSLFFGFPDYTTVRALEQDGGSTLAVYARLRFGKSDLGVNRARVSAWLEALGQGRG